MAPRMTVEQILAAAQHLSVRDKVRLIARLSPEVEQALDATTPGASEPAEQSLIRQAGSAVALLDVAGTWAGDDFEACLTSVYATRQPVRETEDDDLPA